MEFSVLAYPRLRIGPAGYVGGNLHRRFDLDERPAHVLHQRKRRLRAGVGDGDLERSLLSGRFPTSINADQAGPCDNYLPRQVTWISDKLKQSADAQGNATNSSYVNHFIGKGHLGYTTTDHLPINRGYDSHVGYLGGAEQYYQATMNSHDMWTNHTPGAAVVPDIHYSTNYYSRVAVDIIKRHDARRPLPRG